jgi:hypothetical protein
MKPTPDKVLDTALELTKLAVAAPTNWEKKSPSEKASEIAGVFAAFVSQIEGIEQDPSTGVVSFASVNR